MKIEPFRFQIQVTLLQRDDDGDPQDELTLDPVAVYGLAGLQRFLDELPGAVAEIERQRAAPSNQREVAS